MPLLCLITTETILASECKGVFNRRELIGKVSMRINRQLGPTRSARREMPEAFDWLDTRDREEFHRVKREATSGLGLSADSLDQDVLPDSAKQRFRVSELQKMAENESRNSGFVLLEQIEGFKHGYEAGFNRAIDILKKDHWYQIEAWKILEDKTK